MKKIKLIKISMFAVVSYVASLVKVPLFFFAPMYKLDFGESVILLSSFFMGPFYGICVAILKEVINILLRGTRTLFLSEITDFFISSILAFSCSFYLKKTDYSLKNIFIGSFLGTIVRVTCSCILNYYLIIPIFSNMFSLPVNKIISSAAKFIPFVKDLFSFILYVVAPFNTVKSMFSCVVAVFVYRKLNKNFPKINETYK